MNKEKLIINNDEIISYVSKKHKWRLFLFSLIMFTIITIFTYSSYVYARNNDLDKIIKDNVIIFNGNLSILKSLVILSYITIGIFITTYIYLFVRYYMRSKNSKYLSIKDKLNWRTTIFFIIICTALTTFLILLVYIPKGYTIDVVFYPSIISLVFVFIFYFIYSIIVTFSDNSIDNKKDNNKNN